MHFDELISKGELSKAARLFAKEYYDSGRMGYTRRLLIERLADKCDKYDETITRQSVKSEEVQEAIDTLQGICPSEKEIKSGEYTDVADAIGLAITALQEYQPTTRKDRIVEGVAISKTETTSCEWCEKIGKV